MHYNVSRKTGERYVIIATFTKLQSAISFAESETKYTGDYHLVEVVDGGKH